MYVPSNYSDDEGEDRVDGAEDKVNNRSEEQERDIDPPQVDITEQQVEDTEENEENVDNPYPRSCEILDSQKRAIREEREAAGEKDPTQNFLPLILV